MSATPEAQYGLGGAPVRRIDNPVQIVLCSASRPLRPVPTTSAADVRAWLADRLPLVAPPSALPLLAEWESKIRGADEVSSEEAERPWLAPAEALSLIGLLRASAERGTEFTFSAVHIERQGGRLHPFEIPGYNGPLTISRGKYREARVRLLLSGIRKDVRHLLTGPPGWVLLEIDYKSCHAAIGHALSGDPTLGADLDGDIHQLVGNYLVSPTELDSAARKAFGKRVNNAMLFGAGPGTLERFTREGLGREPKAGAAEAVWRAWWARYPRLAAFRDEVQRSVQTAQLNDVALEIVPPSGRLSKFTAGEVQGRVSKGRRAPGRDGMWRTVMSACFRAVEADLMNGVLRRLHALGGLVRVALPLYDGLIAGAPNGSEDAAKTALLEAAEQAVVEIGIPKLKAIVKVR